MSAKTNIVGAVSVAVLAQAILAQDFAPRQPGDAEEHEVSAMPDADSANALP